MHGSWKIALYMVLLSDVDGDILLLPVAVCHVKNMRTWLPTLLYTLLRRIAFKAITFSMSRACLIAVHACAGKIHFLRFTKVQFRDLYWKTGIRYNDAVTCRRSPIYSVTKLPKTTFTFSWKLGRFCKNHPPEGKLPPVSGLKGFCDVIFTSLLVIGGLKYIHSIRKPVDYAIWGVLQQRVHHQPQFKTAEELKRAIVAEWQKLSQRFIDNSISGVDVLKLLSRTASDTSSFATWLEQPHIMLILSRDKFSQQNNTLNTDISSSVCFSR